MEPITVKEGPAPRKMLEVWQGKLCQGQNLDETEAAELVTELLRIEAERFH